MLGIHFFLFQNRLFFKFLENLRTVNSDMYGSIKKKTFLQFLLKIFVVSADSRNIPQYQTNVFNNMCFLIQKLIFYKICIRASLQFFLSLQQKL